MPIVLPWASTRCSERAIRESVSRTVLYRCWLLLAPLLHCWLSSEHYSSKTLTDTTQGNPKTENEGGTWTLRSLHLSTRAFGALHCSQANLLERLTPTSPYPASVSLSFIVLTFVHRIFSAPHALLSFFSPSPPIILPQVARVPSRFPLTIQRTLPTSLPPSYP